MPQEPREGAPPHLALRPFNFDTLAVRVFQYASDERVAVAMGPALLITATTPSCGECGFPHEP